MQELSINIRTAELNDLKDLIILLQILFSQEEEFTPDQERQQNGLLMILRNPDIGRIFVAVRDGTIIGMVSILFTVSTALGGRVGILEDMIIHPDFRSLGAGRRLLHTALAEAKEAGCLRITLLTDSDNPAARAFYTRSGFKESSMTVFRKLNL